MATKQVSVKIQAEGGGQMKAEFTAIGDAAERSFDRVQRSSGMAGSGLQNVGFQVQDLAVQIAGGTDASRALAQQLPQLLSGFGLFGVAAGTASAILIPFAASLMGTSEEAERTALALEKAAQGLDTLRDMGAKAQVEIDKLRFGVDEEYQVDLIREQNRLRDELNAKYAEAARLAATFGDDERARAQFIADANAELDVLRARYSEIDAALAAQENRSAQLAVLEGIKAQQAGESAARQAEAAAEMERQTRALVQGYEVYARTRTESEALAEAADRAGVSAVDLADALGDISTSQLVAASDEALRLAANLGIALDVATALAALGPQGIGGNDPSGNTYSGRGSAPSQADIVLQRLAGQFGYTPPPETISAGGGGGGLSAAEREAARIYDQTRTAAERYKIELEELNALHSSGHLDTDTFNRAVEALGEDLQKAGDLGQKAAAAIRSAFDGLFDDPAAALKNLAAELAKMALYQQLATSLPGLFGGGGIIPLLNANGNAFDGGVVQPFASGGIVSSATMFPMRGGMGVMGEAGPEAIMPLTRIGNKLGVAAAGGGGSSVAVNVNNYGSSEVTTSERRGPDGQRIIDVAVGKSLGSGRQDKALKSRFGSRPERVKR